VTFQNFVSHSSIINYRWLTPVAPLIKVLEVAFQSANRLEDPPYIPQEEESYEVQPQELEVSREEDPRE
jgi:hypothetical protein